MDILGVEFENFREFGGKNSIDFSPTKDQRIHFFSGACDTGKTSLLLALRWCLTGSWTSLYEDGIGPYYDYHPIIEKNNGQKYTKKATLHLSRLLDTLIVEREVTFRWDGKVLKHVTTPRVFVYIKENDVIRRVPDPYTFLEESFPPKVLELYIVDFRRLLLDFRKSKVNRKIVEIAIKHLADAHSSEGSELEGWKLRLARLTAENMCELLVDTDVLRKVLITDDFNLVLELPSGERKSLTSLYSMERMLLTQSFLFAFWEISECGYPIVLNGVSTFLDLNTKNKLMRKFKKVSESHQILLLDNNFHYNEYKKILEVYMGESFDFYYDHGKVKIRNIHAGALTP